MTQRLVAMFLICGAAAAVVQASAPAWSAEPTYSRGAPDAKDIGDGYAKPTPTYPEPRGQGLRLMDILVLVGGLGLAAWLILKVRSRNWTVVLLAGSLVYFGFYRAGCVCPIGAIQNVVLSLIDSSYTISIVVTALFLLPIVATLFFGRVFCGGVRPLGAAQDLMLRKPMTVPLKLDNVLRWGRWIYLGLAVYWVFGGRFNVLGWHIGLAVNRDFIICKYDPFINMFRAINFRTAFAGDWANTFQFTGPWWMWLITGLTLAGSIFIGRPYCRWFCPYGAILGACSRVSRKRVTVMPESCCECGLCADACAFRAIEDHVAVRATCVACARCYLSCPYERMRRDLPVPDFALAAAAAETASPPKAPLVVDRSPVRTRKLHPAADEIDIDYVEALVGKLGRDRSAALPILQAIQARHNYLPFPVMKRVTEMTELSMAELLGLATFFNQFRLAPIGEHLVKVCCGTACHVAGARRVSDAVRLYLGLSGDADTDAARRFTLAEVACVGCCSLAPVMQVDDVTFGHLTAQTAPRTLESFTAETHKRHVAEHDAPPVTPAVGREADVQRGPP